MSKSDWSKVQALKPGVPITVLLYQDQAPRGNRKIKGRFQSATEDSLTMEGKGGQRHTLQKSAVRKVLVLVHRPIWKRYQAWTTTAIGAVLWAAPLAVGYEPGEKAIFSVMVIALPTLIAFAVSPRKGGIYKVPPQHRTQPPADKPSGAKSKAPAKQKDP